MWNAPILSAPSTVMACTPIASMLRMSLVCEWPEQGTPLPNKADAAWAELMRLREQARDLGVDVDERWSIARLREEIDAAGTR